MSDFKAEINDELIKFYQEIEYKGFSRSKVLDDMRRSGIPKDVLVMMAFATALRGPKRALEFSYGGKTATEWGLNVNIKPGDPGLTLNRICSAIPHSVVALFKHFKIPKRVNCDCPAEYQFPAAAGIKMNPSLRQQHRDFAKKFSSLLPGGSFSETIYEAAVRNEFDA